MTEQLLDTYNLEDVKETPQDAKAVIISVEKKKAAEIYGDKAQDKEREYIEIVCENHEFKLKCKLAMAFFPKGSVPDSSKLGKFLKKYGTLNVGKEVYIEKNGKGYYDVRV